jgi:hypothetical protein
MKGRQGQQSLLDALLKMTITLPGRYYLTGDHLKVIINQDCSENERL